MCETVAIYCRVSTAGQDPENQRAILDAIARERGLTVYGVYEDVASGKDAHRPELDRMMADARRHRFDTILTLRVDRLGRSTINLYNLLDDLAHLRITVEFVAQG